MYAYGEAATYGTATYGEVFPWNSRETTALDDTNGADTIGALYATGAINCGLAQAIAMTAKKKNVI